MAGDALDRFGLAELLLIQASRIWKGVRINIERRAHSSEFLRLVDSIRRGNDPTKFDSA